MKKINRTYWIFTILFAALMLFSAIPDILVLPDAVKFMTALGYPHYLIFFLGVAKALGVIAILVPGYPRIKEWAYAGLTFDLIGATYSAIAVGPVQPQMLFMLVFFIPLAGSYMSYHKRLRAQAVS